MGPFVIPGIIGHPVDMRERLGDWLLLAGHDLLAVDATASRVINMDPAAVKHLAMAYDQGLGQLLEDKIELTSLPRWTNSRSTGSPPTIGKTPSPP